DLPVEIDARRFMYPAAYCLAKLLEVGGARSALIDEEIAVKLGNLRATDGKPPHAGGIDELPRLMPGRVREGRAAGSRLDRLGRLAPLGDLFHRARDAGRIAGLALEERLGEDHIIIGAAMPVSKAHIGVAQHVDVPPAIDPPRRDEDILGLPPIGPAIHP